MFSIFNGKVRGLGEQPTTKVHMRVSVKFREYLHYFKGAPLGVFIAIALHADDQGWSTPTIKQLQGETGYEPATISAALTELCSLTINGKRVLFAVQERIKGKFVKNRYLIFPSAAEIAQHEEIERKSRTQKPILGAVHNLPNTVESNTVQPNSENHTDGINHSMEEPDLEESKDSNTNSYLSEPASQVPTTQTPPDNSLWYAINTSKQQIASPGFKYIDLLAFLEGSEGWETIPAYEKETVYSHYSPVTLSDVFPETPSKVALKVSPRFNDGLYYAANYKTHQILIPGVRSDQRFSFMHKLTPDWLAAQGIALNNESMYSNFSALTFEEVIERTEKEQNAIEGHADPSAVPITPPSVPAPKGTRWINPLDGDMAHLVSDTNLPDKTLCGITPLPSYASGGESPNKQVACPDCLKAAQDKPKRVRKPQPTDPLFNAIGRVVLGAKTPADVDALGWSIGAIMNGDKKNKRWIGIITYEKSRQDTEELNYESLAKDVEKFWAVYQGEHPGYELKDCKKFGEQWVKWRGAAIPAQSSLVDDPKNPGKKISPGQLRIREAEERMIRGLNAKQ